MLDRVPREGGVVGLDVELEVLVEAVLLEEPPDRAGVGVVLVFGGLHRLRFDEELTVESDLLLVVHRHVEEVPEVVELALHVGVEERLVPFAAAPEDVVVTAEVVRNLHRLLHLPRRVRVHRRIGSGGTTAHVARVEEEARRSPQELRGIVRHQLLCVRDDLIEVLVGVAERRTVGGDVTVVKAEEGNLKLRRELEDPLHLDLREFHRVGDVVPRTDRRHGTEGIGAAAVHRVPVRHREAEVLLHRLAADLLVGVVVVERHRVPRVGTLVADIGNRREYLFHSILQFGFRCLVHPTPACRSTTYLFLISSTVL